MAQLSNFRVAILATDGFEETELTEPLKALRDAGASVDVVSPHGGQIQGFRHFDKANTVQVDKTIDQADPNSYDAIMLPGGALNADAMRVIPGVQSFIRAIDQAGKPMAVICHAPWELISSGIVKGHTLTSYHTIQDDVRNAGGNWVDREVVVDDRLITSRQPSDLPAFNREMLNVFSRRLQSAAR
jgi:protease I